jgi:hypothetical protein
MSGRLLRALPLVCCLLAACEGARLAAPACQPPEPAPATVDTLPGGILAGDWTITRWEAPPGCPPAR